MSDTLPNRILVAKGFSLPGNSSPCYRLLAPGKYVPASLRNITTSESREFICELGQKNGHLLQTHVSCTFLTHTSVSSFFLYEEALDSLPVANLAPFSHPLIKPSSK